MSKERPKRHKVIDILNDEDLKAHADLLYELDKDAGMYENKFTPTEHFLMSLRFMDTFEDK